jgi:hypothetical protein
MSNIIMNKQHAICNIMRGLKEKVAYWTTTKAARRAQELKDIAAGLAFEVTVGGDTFTVYR